jgi:hypothetical protein
MRAQDRDNEIESITSLGTHTRKTQHRSARSLIFPPFFLPILVPFSLRVAAICAATPIMRDWLRDKSFRREKLRTCASRKSAELAAR